jgi:hypothetical protein
MSKGTSTEAPVMFKTPIKMEHSTGKRYYIGSAGQKIYWDDYVASLQGGGGGGGPQPDYPGEEKFKSGYKPPNYDPARFTPFGEDMPQHPANANSPTGGSYQDWANYWQQYASQFSDPSAYTSGGYPAA